MFGVNLDSRDRRINRKKSRDANTIKDFLARLEDSYKPNLFKKYGQTFLDITKKAPNPFIKGGSYLADLGLNFMSDGEYDVNMKQPNISYGQSTINEAIKNARAMNEVMEHQKYLNAIKIAGEFGFGDQGEDSDGVPKDTALMQLIKSMGIKV